MHILRKMLVLLASVSVIMLTDVPCDQISERYFPGEPWKRGGAFIVTTDGGFLVACQEYDADRKPAIGLYRITGTGRLIEKNYLRFSSVLQPVKMLSYHGKAILVVNAANKQSADYFCRIFVLSENGVVLWEQPYFEQGVFLVAEKSALQSSNLIIAGKAARKDSGGENIFVLRIGLETGNRELELYPAPFLVNVSSVASDASGMYLTYNSRDTASRRMQWSFIKLNPALQKAEKYSLHDTFSVRSAGAVLLPSGNLLCLVSETSRGSEYHKAVLYERPARDTAWRKLAVPAGDINPLRIDGLGSGYCIAGMSRMPGDGKYNTALLQFGAHENFIQQVFIPSEESEFPEDLQYAGGKAVWLLSTVRPARVGGASAVLRKIVLP